VRKTKRIYFSKSCLSIKLWGAIAGAAILLGVMAPPEASAWWDGKWEQRKMIQFDTSSNAANIKENLTDVPALIRLHTGNFSFSAVKDDGSDMRFVGADDKTPLKYHIEKFDPKEEIALIWVKVPGISAGSTQDSIYMYYGNSSAPDGQDLGGTYDVNQVAVYHLNEKEGAPKDATAYANHAAKFSGKLNLPSVIGNGARFGGAEEKMTIMESPSLNFNKGFTFSTWLRLNQPASDAHILSWDDGKQSLVIGVKEAEAYCSLSSGKGQSTVTPKMVALTLKRWHHLAVTVEPNNRIAMYLDGNEVITSKMQGPVPAPSADITIGNSAKGNNPFPGDIDEIQLSNTARNGELMKAAFQGQGPDGVMTTCLEEEAGGGSSESLTIHLMKVIIRTITLDGWLIIGFLALMGSGSFVVFMQKIRTIRKNKKGNEIFSGEFRLADKPLSLLDKNEDMQDSSLYRVYAAGCEELKLLLERKGSSLQEMRGLSERIINGFKAALEKESMYESRKFSAGMFIINMSVAAGPFLGLLGTVWGVMNTFASLAEAGEANLTAIAPGVASALACTLAGLLVAIPSMFASIYITGHVRDMNADMNVFMDEFILKMENKIGDES
jgi:biopolymer transport protein ExbB